MLGSSDHQPMQHTDVRIGCRKFRDHLAVLHDVNAIRELQHLVEPVRDEDEGGARLQGAPPIEKNVDLRALENRRWFVEQDDKVAGSMLLKRQSFRELHHLTSGEAERIRARARLNVDLDLLELSPCGVIKRTPLDEAES